MLWAIVKLIVVIVLIFIVYGSFGILAEDDPITYDRYKVGYWVGYILALFVVLIFQLPL